jgi:hypothetical protein
VELNSKHMYVTTTIKSESEGVQLFAFLMPDGTYDSPTLVFYQIEGEYLGPMDPAIQVWDNAVYVVDELYPEAVRCTKMGIPTEDAELANILRGANCTISELKDMITRALLLNFFVNVDSELLKT